MVSFLHGENSLKEIAMTLCKVIINTNDTDAKHTWVRGTFQSRLDVLSLCEYSSASPKFSLVVEFRG